MRCHCFPEGGKSFSCCFKYQISLCAHRTANATWGNMLLGPGHQHSCRKTFGCDLFCLLTATSCFPPPPPTPTHTPTHCIHCGKHEAEQGVSDLTFCAADLHRNNGGAVVGWWLCGGGGGTDVGGLLHLLVPFQFSWYRFSIGRHRAIRYNNVRARIRLTSLLWYRDRIQLLFSERADSLGWLDWKRYVCTCNPWTRTPLLLPIHRHSQCLARACIDKDWSRVSLLPHPYSGVTVIPVAWRVIQALQSTNRSRV